MRLQSHYFVTCINFVYHLITGDHTNHGDNIRINIIPAYATAHNLSYTPPNDETDDSRIEVDNPAYNGTHPNDIVVESNPAYAGSDIM